MNGRCKSRRKVKRAKREGAMEAEMEKAQKGSDAESEKRGTRRVQRGSG